MKMCELCYIFQNLCNTFKYKDANLYKTIKKKISLILTLFCIMPGSPLGYPAKF
jgi:hypothetical protein